VNAEPLNLNAQITILTAVLLCFCEMLNQMERLNPMALLVRISVWDQKTKEYGDNQFCQRIIAGQVNQAG